MDGHSRRGADRGSLRRFDQRGSGPARRPSQEALARSAQSNEVVVLAQASTARVAKRLDASAGEKILSSPPFAVEDVARRLGHS